MADLAKEPYKKTKRLFNISPAEQLQQDLCRLYWHYSFPPEDGTDLYKATGTFYTRVQVDWGKLNSALDGTFAKARGLRRNTVAIFNFIPQIAAKNIQGISNGAGPEGCEVDGPDGQKSQVLTEHAQEILKRNWENFFSEQVTCGPITGQAYPHISLNGKLSEISCLYPDFVFVTRDTKDIRKIVKIEVKYSYLDGDGKNHDYYELFDLEKNYRELDGEKLDEAPNPWGRIPIVHIQNIARPGSVYGRNCFSEHISDVDNLCQQAGDLDMAQSVYGTPKLILSGAAAPTNGIKMDVRATIEVGADGDVKYLEWEKLGESWNILEAKAKTLKRKAVEFDLIDFESGGIGQISGYALYLKLLGFISKINLQKKQHAIGIQNAIQWALNMELNTPPNWVDYRVRMSMGEPLPADIMNKIDQAAKEKLNGFATNRQAMKIIGKSEQEIQEVEEEKEEQMDVASAWEKEVAAKWRANRENAGDMEPGDDSGDNPPPPPSTGIKRKWRRQYI